MSKHFCVNHLEWWGYDCRVGAFPALLVRPSSLHALQDARHLIQTPGASHRRLVAAAANHSLARDEAQRLSVELTNNLGSSAQQTKLLFLASLPTRASACFWRGTYYSTRGRTGSRSPARS